MFFIESIKKMIEKSRETTEDELRKYLEDKKRNCSDDYLKELDVPKNKELPPAYSMLQEDWNTYREEPRFMYVSNDNTIPTSLRDGKGSSLDSDRLDGRGSSHDFINIRNQLDDEYVGKICPIK